MLETATLRIRFATEDEVPLLLRMIRELAESVSLPNHVVADEASLRHSLFGEPHFAEALVGEITDGNTVGFAVFFHNFSTFLGRPGIYLEDLYVRAQFRGLGYGRAFLRFLAQLCMDRGCERLEWAVLEWNEDAARFYHKLGARSMDELKIHRLDGGALRSLAEGG